MNDEALMSDVDIRKEMDRCRALMHHYLKSNTRLDEIKAQSLKEELDRLKEIMKVRKYNKKVEDFISFYPDKAHLFTKDENGNFRQ